MGCVKVAVFVCLYAVLQATGTAAQETCVSSLKPTANLREVIIAKCTLYQESFNQEPFCEGNTSKARNCTELWETFSTAFAYQPRCNVSVSRYNGYIDITNHPVPRNKSLFWEHVYPYVHRFSNKGAKYFTLSDTMTGYIANGQLWCGDPDQGISEAPIECPQWDPTPACPQSAQRAFWIAASKSFGQRASGGLQIMMNASADPIFEETSYFALYELPFFGENVTKATVLLVNESPVSGSTRCSETSLSVLAKAIRAKGIQYECVENRRDIAQLLCLDNPQSNICSVLTSDTSDSTSATPSIQILAALCIALAML